MHISSSLLPWGGFPPFISLRQGDTAMPQRFEHCQLTGTKITYLGRAGILEDKRDKTRSEFNAWDYLEREGWELVAVTTDKDGQQIAYFKRPVER
jgi:hypothetical protein